MTPEQKKIVKESWAQIVPIAGTVVDVFYDRLFKLDPKLQRHFATTDMATQKQKLAQALTHAVAALDDEDDLRQVLAPLGRRHADIGVVDSQYRMVGSALISALETGLGDVWTEEICAAWTQAYAFIASCMKDGANDALRS